MTLRGHLTSLVIALAILGALLVSWELAIDRFAISPFVLPRPGAVAGATVDLLGQERTWTNTWVTLREILGGFALATVAGVAVGTVLGTVPVLDRAVNPYLVTLQVLPKVAVIPLLLLWLGFGISAKVVIAATFALFPVVAGTRAGLRSVEPGHRDVVTTMQASRLQRLRMVELPSALPSILTGMEIAIVLATVGAVVAEYLAGSEGLGWMAVAALNQLQVDQLYGVIVLLSALGLVVYVAVASLRRVLVPWHQSSGGPGAIP